MEHISVCSICMNSYIWIYQWSMLLNKLLWPLLFYQGFFFFLLIIIWLKKQKTKTKQNKKKKQTNKQTNKWITSTKFVSLITAGIQSSILSSNVIAKYKFINYSQSSYHTCSFIIQIGQTFILTAHNWQKWKRVFLTCSCHKIYRDEAVGL